MQNWKITKQEKLLSATLFDIYRQHIIGPNQFVRDFDVVIRKPTVAVIPLTEDHDIYLVGQDRYLLDKFVWEITAGYLEEYENPLEGAKRELKEETGITAKTWKNLINAEVAATGIKAMSHVFLAKNLSLGKPNPDEGEIITLKKIPIDIAVSEVIAGKITCSVSALAILMVDNLIKSQKI